MLPVLLGDMVKEVAIQATSDFLHLDEGEDEEQASLYRFMIGTGIITGIYLAHYTFNQVYHAYIPKPIQAGDLLTLQHFTLVEKKSEGVSRGGIYHDAQGHPWIIKEPQWGDFNRGMVEHIAAGLYRKILGSYASDTKLILDTQAHEIFIGSKFLDNFSTLYDFHKAETNDMNNIPYLRPVWKGKPVKNFAEVIASVVFLLDRDAHTKNVGIINEKRAWVIAKIDHGLALIRDSIACPTTLSKFQACMQDKHQVPLKKIPYADLSCAIDMIIKINDQDFETIVSTRLQEVHRYLAANNSQKNLSGAKKEVMNVLKAQKEAFRAIQQTLQFEHAIHSGNEEVVSRMIAAGVNPEQKFCPYYHNIRRAHETFLPKTLAREYGHPELIPLLERPRPTPA